MSMASYLGKAYKYFGSHGTYEAKGTTTIRGNPVFDSKADAERLRKAMKGFGTDEKIIIDVLCRKPSWQRQQILQDYAKVFGRDLVADLKSELGGHFEDIMVAVMMPRMMFEAHELRRCMQGVGTDEKGIIDVLCTKGNEEIKDLIHIYHETFQRDLISDIKSDTSREFEMLLVSLLQARRDESQYVDQAKAKADAQALLNAGVKQWGTDESVFLKVLSNQSFGQLREVFNSYHSVAGHDIIDAIKREVHGSFRKALKAIVKSVRNTPLYFARRVDRSLKGFGTSDKTLIRIVVTRSEIDMIPIKQEYLKTFGRTMDAAISGDCRGDYKSALLILIGEK